MWKRLWSWIHSELYMLQLLSLLAILLSFVCEYVWVCVLCMEKVGEASCMNCCKMQGTLPGRGKSQTTNGRSFFYLIFSAFIVLFENGFTEFENLTVIYSSRSTFKFMPTFMSVCFFLRFDKREYVFVFKSLTHDNDQKLINKKSKVLYGLA